MESFNLEPTPKTPKILFDFETGKFLMSGRSIPENSIEFYQPVLDWLANYQNEVKGDTEVEIKLEYFNTSSSKCIVEIFRKLEKVHHLGHPVKVRWFYDQEDEDMYESGEDFKEIIRLPIELIEVREEESSE
jgi:hypothetical protein